ncbi:hypothetical protein V2G26_004345 [Clonostachys chloroleuca]
MDRLFSDVHESAQAAKQACDDYAKTAGFALIIRNTARHSDGRIKRQVLSCCKGRGYTSPCPFRLWVKPTGDNAYFVQPGQSVQYNHNLEKPVAFSAFRRETIELYKNKIIAMHSSGTPPLKISLFIEAEPACKLHTATPSKTGGLYPLNMDISLERESYSTITSITSGNTKF